MHLLRLLTVAAFLVSGPIAVATPLWVDLGPTGVIHNSRTVDLCAPNVQFAGQNIDIDFSFEKGNSQFIRLFTATNNSFQIDVFFRINNAPLPALNFGTCAAGMCTFWLGFCGLTPVRAARCFVENLPKPGIVTASPRLSASVIESW